MVNTIYTIGYSGYELPDFVDELKRHKISCVIDVRSNPYSKFHSDYNKEMLEILLKSQKLSYRNYSKEFGAQQKNRSFYSTDGYLDFDKFAESEEFKSGIKKITDGMEKGYTVALMCAEKDPINCHRTILVGHEFSKIGYDVIHLSPAKTEKQTDIENRLLDLFFPNRQQISFLQEDISQKDLLEKAYKKMNSLIGFRTEEE